MYGGGAGAAVDWPRLFLFFAGTARARPRARDGLDPPAPAGSGSWRLRDGLDRAGGLVGYVRADVLARVQPERLGV